MERYGGTVVLAVALGVAIAVWLSGAGLVLAVAAGIVTPPIISAM